MQIAETLWGMKVWKVRDTDIIYCWMKSACRTRRSLVQFNYAGLQNKYSIFTRIIPEAPRSPRNVTGLTIILVYKEGNPFPWVQQLSPTRSRPTHLHQKGQKSVIYKDFEGALTTKNESNSSVWRDERALALRFRLRFRLRFPLRSQRMLTSRSNASSLHTGATFPSCRRRQRREHMVVLQAHGADAPLHTIEC